MTRTISASTALLIALVCSVPGTASALRNDLQTYRLGSPNTTCTEWEDATDPNGNGRTDCLATQDGDPFANRRFQLLSVDLGLAVTPTPMHPAETLGRAGASMELGARIVQIHADTNFEGKALYPNEGTEPGKPRQEAMFDALVAPTLHIRKGLPFSFEFESKIQWFWDSEMYAAGAGLRWSINEGFDFLPDVSVGGFATRLLGIRDFAITTASVDVMIGKWFGIAGMADIAPYAGWQRVFVSSVSEVIDFVPGAENDASPTSDDTVLQEVFIDDGENAVDRFFFGFRYHSHILQFAIEGVYQPGFLDLTEGTLHVSGKVGLDF